MPRTLLFNRAVALYRPRQVCLAFQHFSTSKPSKGVKEKRQSKSPGASASAAKRNAKTKKSKSTKKKQPDGPPLLIAPGTVQSFASLPHTPYDYSHSKSGEEFVHNNWTVNVSPFLDPEDYSKKSSFFGTSPTKDGTLAAIRLNQGKKTLVKLLQDNINEYNARKQKKGDPESRSFVILGHGVPRQCLQDHVDMADFLLKYFTNASQISFEKSTGDGHLLERLQVISSSKKGKRTFEQWPFEPESQQDFSKQLYLTVMNRIALPLNEVLWNTVPKVSEQVEEEDDDFVVSSTTLPASLEDWKVDILRGSEYPSDSFLMLIVNFMLPKNDSAPGHITIRLCGKASGGKQPSAPKKRRSRTGLVTLRFTATFQNPNQNE